MSRVDVANQLRFFVNVLRNTITKNRSDLEQIIANKTSFNKLELSGNLDFSQLPEAKITFNSSTGGSNDKSFILYKNDSIYHFTGSNQNSRFSIGVAKDSNITNGDGLDLQGGGSLIFNVGSWDGELTNSIGIQHITASENPIKFRINNTDKLIFDYAGGLTASVGMQLGDTGIVFYDNSILSSSTIIVPEYLISGAISTSVANLPSREEVSGGLNNKIDEISSSFSLKNEVSSAITNSNNDLLNNNNIFNGSNTYNNSLTFSSSIYISSFKYKFDDTLLIVNNTSSISLLNTNKFFYSLPNEDFTASFIDVSEISSCMIPVDIFISQSASPKKITSITINNTSSYVQWINNTEPSVNANKVDVYSFNILRFSSSWMVTGDFKTYG